MISLCCQIEWNSLQLYYKIETKNEIGTLFLTEQFLHSQTSLDFSYLKHV